MIERAIKRSAGVASVGVGFELFAALHWTPATFILSAAVGVPLVLAGAVMFLRAVWRHLKERGAA